MHPYGAWKNPWSILAKQNFSNGRKKWVFCFSNCLTLFFWPFFPHDTHPFFPIIPIGYHTKVIFLKRMKILWFFMLCNTPGHYYSLESGLTRGWFWLLTSMYTSPLESKGWFQLLVTTWNPPQATSLESASL